MCSRGRDFVNNSLAGTISPQLSHLPQLTNLGLIYSPIAGTLPTELAQLSDLTYLSVGGTSLSGTLPTWLAQLTRLASIDLSLDPISGTIPTELSRLTRLYNIGINNDFLSGTLPSEMGQLTALRELNVNNNRLSGTIPTQYALLINASTCTFTRAQCVQSGVLDQRWCYRNLYANQPPASNSFACPVPTLSPGCAANLDVDCGSPPAPPSPPSLPAPLSQQAQALAEFYSAAGGPGWKNRDGWLSGEPCSGSTAHWVGLTCHDGNITEMCAPQPAAQLEVLHA